ncbi:unnamed protein product [Diatraea saccharalis]|uniref:PKS/mFAS DH domain-containing protein n=1 Tax=Diatraea saccharalis TaxID=40085 RepID=A0A9N9WHU4_9NEOP|nr:unnamed protein product [Diatraea saccharalis]
MGSQWAGMARTLMHLPVFAQSIERSATLLKENVDLTYLLTEAPETAFDNVINSAVCITSVQIALVDVLRSVGIRPDGVIGHSLGELGCAYADETLTAEQTILISYCRVQSIVDTKLPPGAMAAVGLSWEECLARCPPDVYPACHNGVDSVTISGPVESVKEFVSKLSEEGVFARLVNSSGVAFHSRYVAPTVPALRRRLERLIPQPRPRSPRWVSTSLAPDQYHTSVAKLSDVEYHINNLLSPVRFIEALSAVPERAIVIELGPHALLQSVLKRALPAPAVHVPLLRRDHPYPLRHLLQALGRAYVAGAQPHVAGLYPRVPWPVPRCTPGLASSVRWDHSIEWAVADCSSTSRSGQNIIEIDLSRAEDSFYAGHQIDGRILFPATGYLVLVWRTVAKLHNKTMDETPIIIENAHFRQATILNRETPLRFMVTILEGTGEFNICEGESTIVTGQVRLAEDQDMECLISDDDEYSVSEVDSLSLDEEDIYKGLRLRGYEYSGVFRGIRSADDLGERGHLTWADNWISFMDTMLQFGILPLNSLYIPTRINRVTINPLRHKKALIEGDSLSVRMQHDINIVTSGGVELRGLKMSLARRRRNVQAAPKLERYQFCQYDSVHLTNNETPSKEDALTVCLQIALQNYNTMKLRIVEAALGDSVETLLTPLILKTLETEPEILIEASVAAGANISLFTAALKRFKVTVTRKDAQAGPPHEMCQLVVAANCISQHSVETLYHLTAALANDGILLLQEPCRALDKLDVAKILVQAGLVLIARQMTDNCELLLLRRSVALPIEHLIVEVDTDESFTWVNSLQNALERANKTPLLVYVVARTLDSGILGLGQCLRLETEGTVRVYYLPDAQEPFDPKAPAYAAQVQKDLFCNVLRAGVWGAYCHLPLLNAGVMVQKVEHAYVNTLTRGDLSALRWIESPLRFANELPVAPDAELCHVYCAPLNFRDIMLATGKLPPDALPGNLAEQVSVTM